MRLQRHGRRLLLHLFQGQKRRQHPHYEGKATAPSTTDNYEWGYRVRQGDVVVEVRMEDTRDNKDFFSGNYPPPLSAFKERGWEVEEEFERPLGS